MITVWKFPLKDVERQTIDMPVDAQILSLDAQFGTVVIWALVETNNNTERRTFYIYFTGEPIEDVDVSADKFIGTCQVNGGSLVLHVFEGLLA